MGFLTAVGGFVVGLFATAVLLPLAYMGWEWWLARSKSGVVEALLIPALLLPPVLVGSWLGWLGSEAGVFGVVVGASAVVGLAAFMQTEASKPWRRKLIATIEIWKP